MVTPITSFHKKDCEKIDASKVNAYVEISLDPFNPTGIILDTSWGHIELDLKDIVKAGETVTHLELSPEENPTALKYTREDGEVDCITGDELSRIISLHLLKDVDQTSSPADGDVYVYNETTGLFETYNLTSVLGNIDTAITRINATLNQYKNRIEALEELTTKPDGIPADAVLAWGNRNIYADYTNSDSTDHGIFTHSTNTTLEDDQAFA